MKKIFARYSLEEFMFIRQINDLYCLELRQELEVATGPKRDMLLSYLGIEANQSYNPLKKKTTKVFL